MQYNYTGDDLSDIDEFPTESSSEQPIVYPNVADADSQDCPPAGEVRSGKKRKRTGAQRAAKKAALEANLEDGGYTDKGRIAYREDGGILVTGHKRTCLPDALFHLLVSCALVSGTKDQHADVLSIMPPAGSDHDTLFTSADKYVKDKFKWTLSRVTAGFNSHEGGPALAVLKAKGFFIIQLRITYDKDDKEPDLHCVSYDGAEIKDNARTAKVKIIDDADRSSSDNAREVFNSLFRKGLQVRIKNVYELTSMT